MGGPHSVSACVTAWARGTLRSCHSETKNLWKSELPPPCLRLPVNTLLSLACPTCFSQAIPPPPFPSLFALPGHACLCVWINQRRAFTAVPRILKASVPGGSSVPGSRFYRLQMSQFGPPQLFSIKTHPRNICTHIELELQLKLSLSAIHLS